jgi:hypothetical protein
LGLVRTSPQSFDIIRWGRTEIEQIMKERLIFLVTIFLLCTPSSIPAQGTYTQGGIRSGYGGGSIGTASSPTSANTAAGSASITPSVNRNSMGTGQKPSEGALGLTPQLQKELGIGRQQ